MEQFDLRLRKMEKKGRGISKVQTLKKAAPVQKSLQILVRSKISLFPPSLSFGNNNECGEINLQQAALRQCHLKLTKFHVKN